MSNRISRSSFVIMSGLDVQLPEFLATLAKAGDAVKTQHDKRTSGERSARSFDGCETRGSRSPSSTRRTSEHSCRVDVASAAIPTRAQRCCNFSSTFGLSGSCRRANRSRPRPTCSFGGTSIISVTTEGFAPARSRSTRRSFAHSSSRSGFRRPSWSSTRRRSCERGRWGSVTVVNGSL
jgi:hypothetical protein